MTNSRTPRRPTPALNGAKTLIAAASVAATLSGWAAFTVSTATPPPATGALTPITEVISALPPTAAPDPAFSLPTFPALSTLVPPPSAQSGGMAAAAVAVSDQSAAAIAQAPAAAPIQAPPKPAAPAPTARPRVVLPPASTNRPAPVVRSRSSR